jgi:hypothetical protein
MLPKMRIRQMQLCFAQLRWPAWKLHPALLKHPMQMTRLAQLKHLKQMTRLVQLKHPMQMTRLALLKHPMMQLMHWRSLKTLAQMLIHYSQTTDHLPQKNHVSPSVAG